MNDNDENERAAASNEKEATDMKRKRKPEDSETKRKKKKNSSNNNSNSLFEIPDSNHYQVSYLHRSIISHVVYSPKHDYILSASKDGVVKFWKRMPSSYDGDGGKCLEFIKSYLAHVGPIIKLVISSEGNGGDYAASIGVDGCIKFYDVVSFDATGMIRAKQHLLHNMVGGKDRIYPCDACFVTREQSYLAVSSNSAIYIFDCSSLASDPVQKINLHASFITTLQYSYERNVCLSTDESGNMDIWDCSMTPEGRLSASMPSLTKNRISFTSKMDTDLYALLKSSKKRLKKNKKKNNKQEENTMPPIFAISVCLSPEKFAVYGSDRKIRLFDFTTCKIISTYDERIQFYDNAVLKARKYGIDDMDYGKRAALEREINDSSLLLPFVRCVEPKSRELSDVNQMQEISMSFDSNDGGRYLLIPTLIGIKVMDTKTHKTVRIIGKEDAPAQRFISCTLCQGKAKVDKQMSLARAAMAPPSSASSSTGASLKKKEEEDAKKTGKNPSSDPLLISLAYGKRRLYVFSNNDPILEASSTGRKDEKGNDIIDDEAANEALISRDIFNEAPDAEDILSSRTMHHGGKADNKNNNSGENPSDLLITHGKEAILRTTFGDIHISLYGNKTPQTVENFCVHSQNGYYDDVIFHRVIKGFMLQTGDPLGDGTGGESIWGGEFEDEFVSDLKFDRPFQVAMANAGPGTNGSQFFITTVPTAWLDNKHTIFGRVIKGMDVCISIENVKVNENDKPLEEIRIMSIDIS